MTSTKMFWISVSAMTFLAVAGITAYYTGKLLQVQIRLDCGDVRHVMVWIPYRCTLMSSPERSKILDTTRPFSELQNRWVTLISFPCVKPDDTVFLSQDFYRKALLWNAIDPVITRIVIADIADWICKYGPARHVLPDCENMLSPLVALDMDSESRYTVKPDWSSIPEVREYLISKGLEATLGRGTDAEVAREADVAVQKIPHEGKPSTENAKSE